MNLLSNLRSGLLIGSAAVALAACSGSGSVENGGGTGPVVVNPGNGGGGGGGGGNSADGVLDFTATACPDNTLEVTRSVDGIDITACELSGTITSDTTLGGGNVYILDGSVFVGNNIIEDAAGLSATLTIEPGTVIAGNSIDDTVDLLTVSPGSRIVADGTASDPIVFTNLQDLKDADQAGSDLSAMAAASDGLVDGQSFIPDGDSLTRFGGLAINGLAPINNCPGATGGTVDCISEGEGGSGSYGGSNPADDSGILNYVRVQYAGYSFTPTNQLNGIALQGVGSGTEIDYVHIHNNADDGIEFFGGTVNASHVVVTDSLDDSLDFTFGWTGNLQYALVFDGPSENDNGLEGDNNGDNGFDLSPRTNPTISNVTFIGNGDAATEVGGDDGMALRAGVDGVVANSIVTGFRDAGIDFDQNSTQGAMPELFSIFAAANGELAEDGGSTLFEASDSNVDGNANTLNGLFSGPAEQSVDATDVSNGFVEATDYIGAFADDVQSISTSWLDGWALTAVLPGTEADEGCPTGTTLSSRAVPAGRSEENVCQLSGTIAQDVRLRAGNLYELNGTVFVGTDAGGDEANPNAGAVTATLTVDPGVTIFGNSSDDQGTDTTDESTVDTLVVSRGSQLFVNGTRTSPVIMTNLRDVLDLSPAVTTNANTRWGGLAINGQAPINNCPGETGGSATCEAEGEGGSGLYGGNDPENSSGAVNYLQIRYAGFSFTPTNQLNGIALQGVGSGTELDYIQVESNADDGIEFFGGTVNASHIVITNAADDSIDWTFGWTGNLQYGLVVDGPDENDNGFEGDNNGDNGFDLMPRSNPTIANFTLVGNGDGATDTGGDDGMALRAGVNATIANGVVVGFRDAGIDFDQNSTQGVVPSVNSVFFAGNGELEEDSGDVALANGTNNVDGTNATLLADSDGTTQPLLPNTDIQNATAFTVDEDGDAGTPNEFFEDAPYLGAIEDDSDNWYVGWTFGL